MERIYPVEKELGARRSNGWFSPADAAYQAMLANEALGYGAEGIYALFRELEERDAHYFATLQTRKNALLGCDWRLVWPAESAGASASERAILARTYEVLRGLPDWPGALQHLLDALGKGYALVEILWQRDPRTGAVRIADLVGRRACDFAFDTAGNLYRVDVEPMAASVMWRDRLAGAQPPALLRRPGEVFLAPSAARRMPERKFLVHVFQPSAEAPYGTPLAGRVYWYSWFKRNTLRDWALFNERFGAPSPLARYASTTPAADVARLAESLDRLREGAGLVVPETISVELLETRRAAAATSTFRELADWCNDEISKIVLGQTLTTSEGRRSGSLALGRIHESVKHEYLAADARALARSISRQLVRWIVDFNFGPAAPAPELVFEIQEPRDDQAELEVDRGLLQLGVALDPQYFYTKYRRPQPAPEARKLKYDDANFYQYHLQYGVLTINEVRQALGLEPVAWGDRPPVRSGPNRGAEADAQTRKEPILDSLEPRRDSRPH